MVPADGSYFVEVYSLEGETGNYAFQVLDLASAIPAITLDNNETVSLAERGQRAVVKLDAQEGQSLWFDSLSNDDQFDWDDTFEYSWWLYSPGLGLLSDATWGTDGMLNISAAGTYYLMFRNELSQAQDISFNVRDATNAMTLAAGQTISGSLTTDFETQIYRLPMTAGQTIWLDHLSVSGLDFFESVPWNLRSATGSAVISSSLGTDGAIHATADSEFFLTISGAAYANPVDYEFRVLDASTATSITLDTDISGTLESGETTHLFRLEGSADQRLWFQNLQEGLSGISWQLARPVSGSTTGLLALFNTSMANDRVADLPDDGTYFLAIEGRSNSETADYSFRVNTPGVTNQPLEPGSRVAGLIENPGDRVVYSFHGEPGQLLLIDNLATEAYYFPFSLQLPDGSVEPLSGGSPELFRVSQNGVHQLTVSGRDVQTGAFAFELIDVQAAPVLALGDELSGRLNPAGEFDVYQFPGAKGQRLMLDYISADAEAYWSLFNSAGYVLEQDQYLDADYLITLPADDTYYLVLHSWSPFEEPVNYQFAVRATRTVAEKLNVGSGAGGPLRFSYDAEFNQLVFLQDNSGHVATFTLDATNGNVLESRRVVGQPDPESNESDDQVYTYTYTASGLVDTVTDPLGRQSDYDYDLRGLLQSVTMSLGTVDEQVMRYEYDAVGNRTAAINANGNRTEYDFDELNRLVRVTQADPDGAGPLTAPVTEFSYDANGNLETATDARGNTTTNTYDPLNRRVSSVDQLSNLTQFVYDARGNVTRLVDPLGNSATNEYDDRDRVVQNTDPEGGVTRFVYDFDDNLVALIDAVGNETRFEYDARGRLVGELDPLGNRTAFAYDANNNLVQKSDRIGRVTEFAYDELDRVIAETWINPDGVTIANAIDYTYDIANNLVSVHDSYSSLAFAYDDRDRVVTVDNAGTPDAPHVMLTYTYDAIGNVLTVSDAIEGAAGAIASYQYDSLNRIVQTLQSGNSTNDKRVDFTYNPLGQFANIDRYTDLQGTQLVVGTVFAYDRLNRLEDLRHNNGTDDVAFYEFTYDTASRLATINDADGLSTFSYDDRSQLTGADREAGDTRGDESYTYDANGNRIASHVHGTGYQTGDGNRLLNDGTYNYAHDDEGNLIRRTEIATGALREFEFDHRNRLVSVTDRDGVGIPMQRVEFRYDVLGRRILKHVDDTPADGVDGFFEQYVYDGDNIILDFVDADGGGATASSVVSRRYLHGPAIDQVLAQDDGAGGVHWLLSDHLGTIRDLADNAGLVVNHIVYDAFGNVLSQTNDTVESRYLYTGREFDGEVGLHYYRARYLDSSVGRFLSEDTIGFSGGDVNLYRYVGNWPNRLRDPVGLFGVGGPGLDRDGSVTEYSNGAGELEQVDFNLPDEDPSDAAAEQRKARLKAEHEQEKANRGPLEKFWDDIGDYLRGCISGKEDRKNAANRAEQLRLLKKLQGGLTSEQQYDLEDAEYDAGDRRCPSHRSFGLFRGCRGGADNSRRA